MVLLCPSMCIPCAVVVGVGAWGVPARSARVVSGSVGVTMPICQHVAYTGVVRSCYSVRWVAVVELLAVVAGADDAVIWPRKQCNGVGVKKVSMTVFSSWVALENKDTLQYMLASPHTFEVGCIRIMLARRFVLNGDCAVYQTLHGGRQLTLNDRCKPFLNGGGLILVLAQEDKALTRAPEVCHMHKAREQHIGVLGMDPSGHDTNLRWMSMLRGTIAPSL